jgi:hypothetical protein
LPIALVPAVEDDDVVPEFIAEDGDGEVVDELIVDEEGELGAGAAAVVSVVVLLLVVEGERWLHAAPATAVPTTSEIRIVLRWNEFILTCPFLEWRTATGRAANVHEMQTAMQ